MITARKMVLPGLMALVFMTALSAGCDRKPEQAAAPAPVRLAPISPAPGETPSSSLIRKEDAPHVKVRRDKDGEYTWEITGKDVKAITDADRALRRGFIPKSRPETD
jgi:nitrous oxide reductase accessory protein NosL